MEDTVPHFDLTIVKDDTLEDQVRDYLIKVFPGLSKEEIDIDVFPNNINRGLLNTMMKCSWKNDSVEPPAVIVRVQNLEIFKDFFYDKSAEPTFVQILHKRNCAPRVIATFLNGFCYEYLKGEVLTPTKIAEEPICWLIAKELAKIHATDIEHKAMRKTPWYQDKDIEEKMKDFPKELTDPVKRERMKKELPPREVLEQEAKMVTDHLLSFGDQNLVLCHNDVRAENIVYNKEEGKATFVDFEALSYNEQAFELANHFSRYCGIEQVDFSKYPSQEFQRKWIRVYLEHYYKEKGMKPEDIKDLEIEKLLVLIAKHNLHLQVAMSAFVPVMENFNLPVDFLGFGIESYKIFCKNKEEVLALQLPE